jgi:hypothetical protein
MTNLCILYGLNQIYLDPKGCYESGFFSSDKGVNFSDLVLQAIKLLNKQIRPYAVSLIESIGFDDEELMSAIGNSYGDIYETHLEWAKGSKLNRIWGKDMIADGYMENIMPILK